MWQAGRRMRYAKRAIGLLVVAWVVGAVALFGFHHDGPPVHASAVVVLEGSNTRLPLGVKLIQEGYAPLLIVSQGDSKKLEQKVCSNTDGLHVRVFCFHAKPASTQGEAEEIGRLAKQLDLKRIDVVTSQFHVFRARMLIKRCYHGDLHMVGSSQQEWKFPLYAVQETAKLTYQLTFQRSC
jgi:uncharacterized SAM-binding protein YcdF (DUF218 family)